MTMAFQDLSISSQDYLKVIWDLQEWSGEAVQANAVAKKTGMKLSTVSGAMGRLATLGLVEHTPYGAITLTAEGTEYALKMVRRHRLLEAFLVKTLNYSWDEVHSEADSLEHAVSDDIINRIDASLNHPTHDPHGDPIPQADGSVPASTAIPLTQAPENTVGVVARVSDADPELLRYLTQEGIVVGSTLRIGRKVPFSNAVGITVVTNKTEGGAGAPVTLGEDAALSIRVETTEERPAPTKQPETDRSHA